MIRTSFANAAGLIAATLLWVISHGAASAAERPNILWIAVEDMNGWMGCYGEKLIKTPHIDALAGRGVRFDKVFQPAGVCSATRSAIVTGVMQTTWGIHNHRSSRPLAGYPDRRILDAIHLPPGVKTVPELFGAAGYYTFNEGAGKDDYNFVWDPQSFYDRHGRAMGFQGAADGSEWSGRRAGQPFFGQIQLRGGKNTGDVEPKTDPARVPVMPYYPDHPAIRQEIAHHYDTIRQTDDEVGRIIAALKRDGLLESTIVFFFTDHGCRLPRHKQFVYDGGIHVPLIVAGPGVAPGQVRGDLVSGLDISATSLAAAGIGVPAWMESRDFFAPDFHRNHVISARDRCDYTIERIRSVRTQRFHYLRNFMTDRPHLQPQYRDGSAYLQVLRDLYAAGRLNAVQAAFAAPTRPPEELYDTVLDPHETVNLAADPKYAGVLAEHRRILENWIAETDDKGQYPESDAGLIAVLVQWADRCVNPEYDRVRQAAAAIVKARPKAAPKAASKRRPSAKN